MFPVHDNETYDQLEEIRIALGLRPDAPIGYILGAIHHLKFRPGTKVKTLVALHNKDYTDESLDRRCWGVTGTVKGHHDSHGLCFVVKHKDGTEGCYDPDEIEVTE